MTVPVDYGVDYTCLHGYPPGECADAQCWQRERDEAPRSDEERRPRRVDLGPYLDGTYTPPEPDRGALRDDGQSLLYAGKWHTCIGPTESGKTMLGLVHARDEMHDGRYVVWCHFEEHDPGGTVARLLSLGVAAHTIRQQFVWLGCDRAWLPAEFAAELADVVAETQRFGTTLGLVGLDGINAACTQHNQDPEKTPAVGWYRRTLVTPAALTGAAVLSLGHPVKDRTRQNERHGYGASAWLDEADGVAFRLLPGRQPIRRGETGTASLYSVKDRYGSVTRHGVRDSREGWTYLAALVVDDTAPGRTAARLSTPNRSETETGAADPIDKLAAAIVTALAGDQAKARFDSERDLRAKLRAAAVLFSNDDLEPALVRMERAGRLERDVYARGRARGGWVLGDPEQDEEEDSV